MKKYWIEKVEYPNGKYGFADCIPYKDYTNKKVVLKDFETLVKENYEVKKIFLSKKNLNKDVITFLKKKFFKFIVTKNVNSKKIISYVQKNKIDFNKKSTKMTDKDSFVYGVMSSLRNKVDNTRK